MDTILSSRACRRIVTGFSRLAALVGAALTSFASETVTGVIGAPGGQVVYAFTNEVPAQFVFDSRTDAPGLRWSLTGPFGVVRHPVALRDADAASASREVLSLQAGPHQLTIAGVGEATGPYEFRLWATSESRVLQLGTPTTNAVTHGNVVTLYQFAATEGDRLQFTALARNQLPGLFVRLADPTGDEVFGAGWSSQTSPVLRKTGTYTLTLEDKPSNANAGDYQFQANLIPGTPPPVLDGIPLAFGAIAAGELVGPSTNRYRIEVPSPTRLLLDPLLETGTGAGWELVGPGGFRTQLRGLTALRQQVLQVPAGAYQLNFIATTAGTHPYRFRCLDTATISASPIGEPVTAEQADPTATTAAVLNLSAGQRISLQALSRTGHGTVASTSWSLIRPDGVMASETIFNVDSPVTVPFTAPASGRYLLLIPAPLGATQPGSVQWVAHPSPAIASTLALGEIHDGVIDSPGTTHHLRFVLPQATRLIIDPVSPVPFMTWHLSNGNGPITSGRFEQWFLIDAPAGPFEIRVELAGARTSPFAIQVLEVGQLPFLPLGPTNHVALPRPTAVRAWRIPETADPALHLQSLPGTGFNITPVLPGGLYDGFNRRMGTSALFTSEVFPTAGAGGHVVIISGVDTETSANGVAHFALFPTQSGVVPMELGAVVQTELLHPGQHRRLTFTTTTDRWVQFIPLNPETSAQWILRRSSGVVAQGQFRDSPWGIHRLTPGTYEVLIQGTGDNTGPAAFQLIDVHQGTDIALDQPMDIALPDPMVPAVVRFSLAAGERIYLKAQEATGFAGPAQWALIDPAGRTITAGFFADFGPWTAPSAGTYSLVVRGTGRLPGSAGRARFVVHRSPETGVPLSIGTLVASQIAVPGEAREYHLQLTQPKALAFDARSEVRLIAWSLRGPGVDVPKRSFEAGDLFLGTLPAGDHVLRVEAPSGESGPFGFALLDLDAGIPAALGSLVEETVAPANALRAFHLNLAAGQKYDLSLETSSGFNFPGLTWTLLDPLHNIVSSQASPKPIPYTALASGIHRILVGGSTAGAGAPGTIRLRVNDRGFTPPPGPLGTPLVFGTVHSGTPTNSAEVHQYHFSLGASTLVAFDSLSANPAATWSLSGPAGLVVNNSSHVPQGHPTHFAQVLPPGGYQLAITSPADQPYAFVMLSGADARPVTSGVEMVHELADARSTALFRLDLTASTRVLLQRNGSSPGMRFSLVEASGRQVGADFAVGTVGPVIAGPGALYLRLDGNPQNPSNAATLRFTLQAYNDPPTTPLVTGVTYSNRVVLSGEVHRFEFNVAAPEAFYFDPILAQGAMSWQLQDPLGSIRNQGMGSADGPSGNPFLPLYPGRHVVSVWEANNQSNSYAFRLLRVADAPILSPGIVLTNELSPAASTRLHRFQGVAGRRLVFESVGNGNPAVFLRLVAPDGSQPLAMNLAGPIAVTLPDSGQYLLAVEGAINTAGSTTHRLRVSEAVDTQQPLVLGEVVEGGFTTPQDLREYFFQLDAPALLVFDDLLGMLDCTWALASGGVPLVQPRSFANTDPPSQTGVVSVRAGGWKLTVRAQPNTTPNFRFRLLDTGVAPLVAPGVLTEVVHTPGNSTRVFRLALSGGQTVVFDSPDAVPGLGQARLFGPSHQLLTTHREGTDSAVIQIRETGFHYLVFEGPSNDSSASRTHRFRWISHPAVLPIPLPQTPVTADLVVEDVAGPATALPGVAFPVTYRIRNLGVGPASGWISDFVQIGDAAGTGSAYHLGGGALEMTLPAGASQMRTQWVALPWTGPAGALRLAVRTDTANTLVEIVETNNLAGAAATTQVAPRLHLLVSTNAIPEVGGNTQVQVLLQRNGDATQPLIVQVGSSAADELAVPATVVMPAGQATVGFGAVVQADGIYDGAQETILTASAAGFEPATASVLVLDSDLPPLVFQFPTNRVAEGRILNGTLHRPANVSQLPLSVALRTADPSRLVIRPSVLFGAGATSAPVEVLCADDVLIGATSIHQVAATAAGFADGLIELTLLDDDVPSVRLSLSSRSVPEGAGASAVTATVTRDPVTSQPVLLRIQTGNTNDTRTPSLVTIPANKASVSFPVAVVDNTLVEGTRTAVVGGIVRDASGASLGEIVPDLLTITDDDGPTLTLVASLPLVPEGRSNALTLTVRRNTSTTTPLTVQLASSDLTEAALPTQVTIAAGASEALVTVASIDDQVSDGNQTVVLTAVASGFTTGSATIVVSDSDLPDLVVAGFRSGTNVPAGDLMDLTLRLENRGVRTAGTSWVHRVMFSKDALIGDDTLAAQIPFEGSIPAGSFVEQTVRVRTPATPGAVWVVVETDALQDVAETLEDNNARIGAAPIQLLRPYAVTVSTPVDAAPTGTPVQLAGRATRPDGSAAANVPVLVHVGLRGIQRRIEAVTDTNGNYVAVFDPLRGEAGRYQLGADHPGIATTPVQDEFVLLGFQPLVPGELRLAEGGSASLSIPLQNLGDVPLTGLAASVLGAPTNITSAVLLSSNRLAGDGSVLVNLSASAPEGIAGRSVVRLQVASAEGVLREFDVPLFVEALRARLAPTPGQLESGMKRGQQRSLAVAVTNTGGLPTGPIRVMLPPVPWLGLATPSQMPSLEPGEGTELTLLLTPAPDLPLGPYTGTIALQSSNAAVSIPYEFRCLSDAVGSLRVLALDEFTYYAEGAPRVGNARLVLRDAITGETRTANIGPTGEVLLHNLPESYYYVDVDAPNHSTFHDLLQLQPGRTNDVSGLMSRQSVRYTWTVTPVQIEDRYTLVVDTTFETAVPKPVITVDPAVIDMGGFLGAEKQVNVTIRNHGLIAAKKLTLDFPAHSRWDFLPLIEEVGDLGALSSITVPVIIRRSTGGETAGRQAGPALENPLKPDACSLPAKIEWDTPCGDKVIKNSISLGLISLIPACFNMGDGGMAENGRGDEIPSLGGSSDSSSESFELRGGEGARAPIFHDVPSKCDPCEQARINNNMFHCIPKLIPGMDPYDLIGGALSSGWTGGGPAVRRTAGPQAGFGGIAAKVKSAAKNFGYDDGAGAYNDAKAASDNMSKGGDTLDSVQKIIKSISQGALATAAAAGGEVPVLGPLIDIAECEYENAKLPECNPEGGSTGPGFGGGIIAGALRWGRNAAPAGMDLRFQIVYLYDPDNPVFLAFSRLMDLFNPVLEFYGDARWWRVSDGGKLVPFLTAYVAAIETNSPGGIVINAAERAQIEAIPLPLPLTAADGANFVGRWNRTVDYIQRGILTAQQVPAGEDPNFFEPLKIAELYQRFFAASDSIVAEGHPGPLESALLPLGQSILRASKPDGGAICARVKLRLEQSAVLSRDAFRARLEIDNATDAPLTEVSIEVRVRTLDGRSTTGDFQIRGPELAALSAADGTGVVGVRGTGSAVFTLVPTSEAAPTGPVVHYVEGTLRYRQDGILVSMPLAPSPITVLPNPRLVVKYFHERDVYSDDPFTPVIEPAVPYSLAILVQNEGAGLARQMRITSAQPKIIENEKGLLVNFEIIGSEVAGKPVTPSLHVNLGDIAPGTNAIARWLFRSSLQGLFIDYKASFEHVDGLGDPRVSLIDRVEIHEMNRIVEADGSFADGRPDFLVNDVTDLDDLPDTIHLSSGGTLPVSRVTEATLVPSPASGGAEYHVTVRPSTGWVYFRIASPSGSGVASVRRPDGSLLPKANAWVTDRTFLGLGLPAQRENLLHFLDHAPSGQYTVTFGEPGAGDDSTAPTSRVVALPSDSATEFPVAWDGSDVGLGLTAFDLYVSEDGAPFFRYLERTPARGTLFRGREGASYRFYTVGIDAAGNRESIPQVPDALTAVTITNRLPVLVTGGDAVIDEVDLLERQLSASDPDAPAQSLTYSVTSGPAGVVVDPTTGLLQWVPGEGNGPSTNTVVVRVTDNGNPPRFAEGSFRVFVREVNEAPVVAPIPDRILNEQQVFAYTPSASDSDLPPQRLTWSIAGTAPVGLTVDPVNGRVDWRPNSIQGPAAYPITLRVVDNGSPALSSTQRFTLYVRDGSADMSIVGGTSNTLAGSAGAVPLYATAGPEVSRFTVRLATDDSRLTGLYVRDLGDGVESAQLVPLGNGESELRFQLQPASILLGATRRVANIGFAVPANATSEIVSVGLHQPTASGSLGPVASIATRPGRAIVVGNEPILLFADGRFDAVQLFGQPGVGYRIEHATDLEGTQGWNAVLDVTGSLTPAPQVLSQPGDAGFFRVGTP